MNILKSHIRPSTKPAEAGLIASSLVDETDACLLIVEPRALERECLALSLSSIVSFKETVAVGSFEEWRRMEDNYPSLAVVLLNIGGQQVNDPATSQQIAQLVQDIAPAPLVVLADSENVNQVLRILELGAKGFIPTTVGIGVCSEAIALARAGGVFVPGSALMAMRRAVDDGPSRAGPMSGLFTSRQGAVLEALRRGKANKLIAHELALKESTVKVHIRNIMKKLKATNRTEAVYKLNSMMEKK